MLEFKLNSLGVSGQGWVNSKFLLAFPPYAHC